MSEIRANTISDAAGTGPVTLTKQSAAKAYASASGSTGLINSFNVASFVDGGTGLQTVNLTNSMAAKPVVTTGAEHSGGPYRASVVSSLTTVSAIVWTTNNTSGASVDISYSAATGQGDLA